MNVSPSFEKRIGNGGDGDKWRERHATLNESPFCSGQLLPYRNVRLVLNLTVV